MSDSPAVRLSEVTFAYDQSGPPVLAIPDWSIPRGEHIFLSGDSGSGKSTLLNLLGGTLTPSSGNITLLGEAFSSLPARKRDAARATHIGVVFQQFNLISYLSVKQNIAAAAYFAGRNYRHIDGDIIELLDNLHLPANTLNVRADSLSVGQQQRVSIARALINKPELLLVDEPTSALDTRARDAFMEVLTSVATNSAMLFVSHDPGLADNFKKTLTMRSLNEADKERQS
ncbi:ATP-binding cassette domain-containing protein [Alteromonas halophila]|uniref:Methionine ABC transporter ATP-binding protein n=1 Tax=Alteromonas halophila TaxID=516698 RepID=A0A918MWA4_9ALTE|nr:ATP-binding cassette domain-containing protein [Alteromonas halophila]GGW78227.1 methionine ABC transporter ATP-binding protein [Alteromonas halophila]